jgi:hypothetical protein
VRPVERIVDNRFASSSWREVEAALNLWRPFAAGQGWPTIIRSNDPAEPGCFFVFRGFRVTNNFDGRCDTVEGLFRWRISLEAGVIRWRVCSISCTITPPNDIKGLPHLLPLDELLRLRVSGNLRSVRNGFYGQLGSRRAYLGVR